MRRVFCDEERGGNPDSRQDVCGDPDPLRQIGGGSDSCRWEGGGPYSRRWMCGGPESRRWIRSDHDASRWVGGGPDSRRWIGECGDFVSCPETSGGHENVHAAWGASDCQQPNRSNESHQSKAFDESISLRARASGVPRVRGRWGIGV